MNKVVIFAEGAGELVFIRYLLQLLFPLNDISFECLQLRASKQYTTPYPLINPLSKVHFLIINVGNDEKVISVVKESGPGFIKNGYEIFAIRDMYSSAYQKVATTINQVAITLFVDKYNKQIIDINQNGKIHLIFAIMEFEAWLISIPCIFTKINPMLTNDFINRNLGINLDIEDPEKTLFHPCNTLKDILKLAGKGYDKHESEVNSICSNITSENISEFIDRGFCSNLIHLIIELDQIYRKSA